MDQLVNDKTINFIEKAKLIHKNLYDYSEVVYKSCNENVKLYCLRCNKFFYQKPSRHLENRGCYSCNTKQANLKQVSNTNEFIKKANNIHNCIYSYHDVSYVNNQEKIIITCNLCKNNFKQIPSAHLSGQGCPRCCYSKVSNVLSMGVENFVKKAIIIHGEKYDYSKVIYKNAKEKVQIICNTCKNCWLVKPNNFLYNKSGCPFCSDRCKKSQNLWLDSLGIPNDQYHREVKNLIKNRKFVVDGYDPLTNTIYEFYGDRWHGNPKIYKPTHLLLERVKLSGIYEAWICDFYFGETTIELHKSVEEINIENCEKEAIFKKAGFNFVVMWENDWNKIKNE